MDSISETIMSKHMQNMKPDTVFIFILKILTCMKETESAMSIFK